jgi:hypothetical protein
MRSFGGHLDTQSPDQRLREVAGILAGAVVRLRLRAALPGGDAGAEKPPESVSNCLEVPSESMLSVHPG